MTKIKNIENCIFDMHYFFNSKPYFVKVRNEFNRVSQSSKMFLGHHQLKQSSCKWKLCDIHIACYGIEKVFGINGFEPKHLIEACHNIFIKHNITTISVGTSRGTHSFQITKIGYKIL